MGVKRSLTISNTAQRRLRRDKGVVSVADPDAKLLADDDVVGSIVSYDTEADRPEAEAAIARLRTQKGYEGEPNAPQAYPQGGFFIFVSRAKSTKADTADAMFEAEGDLPF